MNLSIIVSTYQASTRVDRFIPRLVDALGESSLQGEVILVDDGSCDGTGERLSALCPDARLIRHFANRGMSAGRNTGAAAARGDWLLFCDDDLDLSSASLERLWFARSDRDCLVPLVHGPEGRLQNAVSLHWCRLDIKQQTSSRPLPFVGYPMGCCCLISRRLFEQVGGYDERYTLYYEDADLGVALWRAGASVRMVEEAVATHHEHGLASDTARSRRRAGRVYEARWVFCLTALSGWRRIVAIGLGLPRTILESARKREVDPLRGYVRFVLRLPALLMAPRRPKGESRLSDAHLFARLRERAR